MIERITFVQNLLSNRKDSLRVVCGIGTSTWDLMSAGDNKKNFGFIGAMGQAAARGASTRSEFQRQISET